MQSLLCDTIRQASGEGRLGLFIGAGISKCAGLPLWGELLRQIDLDKDLAKIPGGLRSTDLALRADIWIQRCGDRRDLLQRVVRALRPADPFELVRNSAVHQILAALKPAVVVTTNYDNLLEHALASSGTRRLVGNAALSAWRHEPPEIPLLHMHGHVDHPDDIVITRADYRAFPREHAKVCQVLTDWLQGYTFLFLGYGAGDEDLGMLAELEQWLNGKFTTRHHALALGDEDASLEASYQLLNTRCTFLPVPEGRQHAEVLADFLRHCTPASTDAVGLARQAISQQLRQLTPELAGFPDNFVPALLSDERLPPLPPPDKFIGREIEWQQLQHCLCPASGQAGVASLVSLRARGGLGKTTLAGHFAREALHQANAGRSDAARGAFPDGVLWHRVGLLSYAQSVEDMLLACGHRNLGGLELPAREAWLRHTLKARKILVVLDNVDHVQLAPPLLQLLRGHPVLVTSRHFIENAEQIELDTMGEADAIDLFCSRSSRHADRLPLTDREEIRRIVIEQLYGVPLAIVLAAHTAAENRLDLPELARRLQAKGLEAIDRRHLAIRPDVAQKDLSVEASFRLSWEFVTDPVQRRIFALASLFGGRDFAQEDLATLLARIPAAETGQPEDTEVEEAIDNLVRLGLMERSQQAGRVSLWPLLREFAQRELDALQTPAGEQEGAAIPISRMHLEEIQIAIFQQMLKGGAEYASLNLENIEALLLRTESPERATVFFGLLFSVGNAWWLAGRWAHRRVWLERGAALTRRLPQDEEQTRLWAAQCEEQIVDCLSREGNHSHALTLSRQVQTRWQDLHRPTRTSFQDYVQTESNLDLGHPDAAWQTLVQGLRFAYTHQTWSGAAAMHRQLGNLAPGALQGTPPAKLFVMDRCWQQHDRNPFNELLVLLDHAAWLQNGRDWSGAKALLNQATVLGECGREGRMYLELGLARWYGEQAIISSTHEHLVAAEQAALDTGSLALLSQMRLTWAELLGTEKQYRTECEERLHQAENGFRQTRNLQGRFGCLLLRCEQALMPLDEPPRVHDGSAWLAEAEALAPRIPYLLAHLRLGLLRARWHSLRDNTGEAARWLHWVRVQKQQAGFDPAVLTRMESLLKGLPEAADFPASAPDLRPTLVRRWTSLCAGKPLVDADGGPDMVLIPAGFYNTYPDAESGTPREIWLPAFLIDRSPVTNEEYACFCAATGEDKPANWKHFPDQTVASNARTYPPEFASHPVTAITVDAIRRYAAWRGKQLPNEVEWRAAVQGPELWPYPWGKTWDDRLAQPPSSCTLGDYSAHPLSTFDEEAFRSLLEGSLSLSLAEKLKVVDSLPVLSQFQIDELIETFNDERQQFDSLRATEGEIIAGLEQRRDNGLRRGGRRMPHAAVGLEQTASPFNVLDGFGNIIEWLEPGRAIGICPEDDYVTQHLGNTASFVPINPEAANTPQYDHLLGFRCVIPLTDPDYPPPGRFAPFPA